MKSHFLATNVLNHSSNSSETYLKNKLRTHCGETPFPKAFLKEAFENSLYSYSEKPLLVNQCPQAFSQEGDLKTVLKLAKSHFLATNVTKHFFMEVM